MLAFRPEDGAAEPAPARESRPVVAPAAKAPVAGAAFDGDWPKLSRQLEVSGVAKELARNAELARYEDGCFDLIVPKAMPHLADAAYRDKLRSALQQRLGNAVRVRVSIGEIRGASVASLEAIERDAKRAEAVRSVQGDRFVNDLVTLLDGRVVEQSVQSAGKGE
jgi:DNA polymerase-3 subunit gamma/tau